MENTEKKRGTKVRTLILLAVLLIGSAAALYLQKHTLQEDGTYAIVQVNGEVAAKMPLSKDNSMVVGDGKKDYNIVEVKDGKVRMNDADCPDKICVNTGWVSDSGSVIACLPHGVIVIVANDDEDAVDTAAY
ncbi:MAG: NusG domain II-containing protein [Eubacteriales bacterium]|nr:NusG domain II-containing protein [Eubacteriales bacterium]